MQSSASEASHRSLLPTPLTPFVGRERELHALQPLLQDARLLTLTGVGGTGKTRLAIELARASAASFPDGVIWSDLSGLSSPSAVAQHVATALGLREVTGASAASGIAEHLQEGTALLVLDNCEHVIDACASLADTLLRSCPHLTILATSREALGIGGERAWLVPPLSLPGGGAAATVATVQEAEAIVLFVDRARSVSPTFDLNVENVEAVVRVCRRLDGIPLAIELAAARVKMLTPQEIATRLEDSFRLLASGSRTTVPRHRTLREAIDWSYALLSESEQTLLQRLSVFAGGFRLESAEGVCSGPDLFEYEVLDTLGALVDKSLVVVRTGATGSRYSLLETVKQYALDKLRESGQLDALRQRHADHYLAFVEKAAPRLVGGAGDQQLIARVREDSDNLRALAAWSEENDERAGYALRLGNAIQWVLFAAGWFNEGRALLERALARSQHVDAHTRALGTTALAAIYLWQGDTALIPPLLEPQIIVLRASDDRCTHAYALSITGAAICQSGDPFKAQPILEEAVHNASQSPSPVLHAIALYWRGIAARARDDFELAQSSFEKAVGIGRDMHNPPSIGHPLTQLGRLHASRNAIGDATLALTMLLEAVEVHRRVDDRWGIAWALEGLATVSAQHGEAERAARLQAGAESLRATMSAPRPPAERAEAEATIATAKNALGARFKEIWTQARAASLDEVLDYALAISEPPVAEEEPAPVIVTAAPSSAELRVNALGPLQVFCSGVEVDVRKWPSAKARELLAYLMSNPEGVTREQVGAALWPEASSAQLRNSFHVTVHRLRKGVTDGSWIEAIGERYRIAPNVHVKFDVAIFEHDTVACLRELRRGLDASPKLRDTLALYRGDFLQGEKVGDWHLEIHDRLQRLYRDGLRALGNQEAVLEHFEEAAGWFERLIAIDELDEDAYRRIMQCRMRMGDRADAARLYQKLVDRLETELGTQPSRETRAMYLELQGQRV